MSAPRFEEIEELFNAARESTAAERMRLLESARPELRREVEALHARYLGLAAVP